MSEKAPDFGMRQDVPDLSNTSSALASYLDRVTEAASRLPHAPTPKNIRGFDRLHDPQMIAQVRHCMNKNEKLGQFIARTGLGKAQAMKMTREEISRFVENSAQNEADEIPVTYFELPAAPENFKIIPVA